MSAAMLLATVVSVTAQTDQEIGWCNGQDDATREQSISGCTAMMKSGAYSGEDLAIILNNRALAYLKSGQLESAVQDYDQAMRLRPNFLSALIGRGFAYLGMKDYDSAMTGFQAALEAYPQNPALLYGRGLARRARGDTAGANGDLAAARRLDPAIAQALPLTIELDAPPAFAAVAPSAAPSSASAAKNVAVKPSEETASLPPAAAAMPAAAEPAKQTATPPAHDDDSASAPLPADIADVLIGRGNDLLRTGDIAAARLAFERAATGGNKVADTGIAKTYDPVFLAQNGVRGFRGDPARAAFWYRKAAAEGSREAEERLTRLRAQFPQ